MPSKKSRKVLFWRDKRFIPYLYITPNAILFVLFMIIPLIMTFGYSTTKWNGIGDPKFIGLENYAYLLGNDVFRTSLFNTFYYCIATVPILMALALAFAVLLNRHIPARGILRSAIYIPAVVSTVVAGTVFTWIFQDNLGLINYLLGLVGISPISWTSDPKVAMIMLIVATIWQRTGYNMVIYLAGLQSLSPELLEAATIDGCTPWQRFRYVTLPLLKNTHMFVMITCLIYSFRSFDLVYTMTQGGPLNSTQTLVMYVYKEAFTRNYYGRAAAAGAILFIIMLVMTVIRFKAEKED